MKKATDKVSNSENLMIESKSIIQKMVTKKQAKIEDSSVKRVKHYTNCMVTGDVQSLFEALLEDMDKEKILEEIRIEREKNPNLTQKEYAELEINRTAKIMSSVAIGSGLAWVIPGVSLATGPLATVGELIGLFVFQSRLVVKVAAYFDIDISKKERARDVLVCIACSSTGKGTSLLARRLSENKVFRKSHLVISDTYRRKNAQICYSRTAS